MSNLTGKRPHYINLRISWLVTKLTSVPSAAVNTVCSTSPSEKLAQMEHNVPPRAEIRISFHCIDVTTTTFLIAW